MEEKDKEENEKARPWWKRGLRILGWITLVLFVLFISLILFIRSPWGQNIIVGKITTYISEKTHTKVSIDKLFITFTGDIDLQGLYVEDKKGDTLIYSDKLQVDIPLWPIIRGNPISIDGLEWTGLRANIVRKDSVEGYNFQFIIDAFASDSTNPKKEKKEKKPLKISIGTVDFSDFRVNFEDKVIGMKANLDLGKLHLEGKNFDLKKMDFQASEIFLENTRVTYVQTKRNASSDSTKKALPYLSLDNLKIKNVIAHYESVPDSMVANFNLAELQLQAPKVDLNSHDIVVGEFMMKNSTVEVRTKAHNKLETKLDKDSIIPEIIKPFMWPSWDIKAESITLINNNVHYQAGAKSEKIKSFNPNYIEVSNFNFEASDIVFSKKESAKLRVKSLSFTESSGLVLKQLAFSAALDTTLISVDNLVLIAGNTALNANVKTQFSSIQQLIKKPEESRFILDLKNFVVDMNDVFIFQPKLRKNETLRKIAKQKFTGQIKANGTLAKLNLPEFWVNWGQNTKITTRGGLKNLMDSRNLIAEIDNLTIVSTRSDIANFISEKKLGISIPQKILVQSKLNGKFNNFKTITQLTFPEGKIKIDGQFKQQNEIAFSANIDVMDLKLGRILDNPKIGTVAFNMKASGNGNNLNDLNAKLASKFSKLEFNAYDFSALQLDGELNNGKGNVTLKYKDENLDLLVDSKIQLDSVSPKIGVDFKLEGADLYALGLTEKQIKAKLMMIANFKGNAKEFDFDSHFSEGFAIYDESSYSMGNLDLIACVRQDSAAMDVTSNFLNGKLRANAGIDRLTHAIKHHLEGYFTDYIEHVDSFSNPVKLQLNMQLSETKLVTDFLVPDIKTMDTLKLNIDFDQKEKTLAANFKLPYIDYADKTLDSLLMNFTSTENEAKFVFGFNELNAKPFLMNRTFFDGELKNKILNLNFNSFDGEKEMYVVQTVITGKSSDLKIHFNPEKLIFQGEPWSIPVDNQIGIHNKKITAQNFVLSRNEESLTIANNLMDPSPNNIGIGFKNYKLSNLLGLFNQIDLIASGYLQGNIVAVNPFGKFGLNADFSIENLTALKAPLGKLTLKATKVDNYIVSLDLKGDDVDFLIKGAYSPKNVGSEINFKLDLNKIGMKTIAIISGESLKDASGNISGQIAVQGKMSAPKYEGYLQFNDAVFNVSQLNSQFRLANDKLKIDNKNITLTDFTVEDEQHNTFALNGSVSIENISNPEFDLRINGKNFQALNSTKEDNDLYYGIVNFDVDGTIKGKMSFPKVNLNIDINKSTDFTYVIPESQAKLEKRDGIVEFVNKQDPDNIITRTSDSANIATLKGIELHANLKIDKGATFNVIIDPNTGDNLKISGVGALDFNIANNGRMSLSGRYDINNGHYSLSLYNLVKRKFELEPGSSVTWRGDPMDAELNVTAKYSVEASASGLMASQTAGASEEIQNKYRQTLPFFVYMTITGELNQPKLNFRIDMPEDSRGAIDGTVYGRIKQLNSEEDELNKQVFSLLVLRKFYPNAGSDGSDGGAASMVRKNINQALSDQLNAFSGKLMGNTGIELDFGLNSYTDYQGENTQQRTDLNVTAQKKMLNDRLIVQVGSNVSVEGDAHPGEEKPLVGNASIQYLLTKDGRWRLKGFRNNQYENVIDGQVFVNGISLIFQRQFNRWRELSAPPAKEDTTGKSKTDKKIETTEKKSNTDKKNK